MNEAACAPIINAESHSKSVLEARERELSTAIGKIHAYYAVQADLECEPFMQELREVRKDLLKFQRPSCFGNPGPTTRHWCDTCEHGKDCYEEERGRS